MNRVHHINQQQIIGVVLAGGQSRRMGGMDKATMMLGGETMLARVTARLAPMVGRVVVNENQGFNETERLGLPRVADPIAGFLGPLAGVLAGLDYARDAGADAIVTAAVDTPFFPTNLVDRLLSAAANSATGLAMASTPDQDDRNHRHPTFGLWPVALADDLRAALNDGLRKVVIWTDQHDCQYAEFSTQPFNPFFNVNTPDDMTQAETLIEEHFG